MYLKHKKTKQRIAETTAEKSELQLKEGKIKYMWGMRKERENEKGITKIGTRFSTCRG